jgi:O-antigen ligase
MLLINNKILFFIICLAPFFLFTGPFLPDLFLSISSLYFLFFLKKKSFKRYFLNKFSIIFFVWCAYLILLSIFSVNIKLSLESSLFYFRFGLFVLAIWYSIDTDIKFIKYFFYSLFLSVTFVIFDAYIQLYFGYNLLNFKLDISRLSGIFNEEKILGSYLIRLTPLILILSFHPVIKSKKIILTTIFIFSISIFIIFFSGERSALVLLIIVSVLLFLFLKGFIIHKTIILFSLLILSFVIIIFNQDVKNRLINSTIDQLTYENKPIWFTIQHEAHAKTALKIINYDNNYIFGIGPKMFREVCKLFPSYHKDHGTTVDGCSTHPHHTYLQLLTETGIVGSVPVIFVFFLISFILLKKLFNKNLSDNNQQNFKILLLIPIFISLFPLVPTGNFFNNWISIIYFLPCGLYLYEYYKLDDS